ncbi:hypothetical protein LV84_00216 [Algoriphagus ratkowskyi]|uniref:Type IX secretion system PorP/SprF family membrane protein n=1 Tax=Algoriphagus ratkowskyi TaxID=57028 RepID=A0A2W7RK70_9BACT|nr:hypothetical protein [Algoriphagus ratkowskyi]PZX61228.1 hypothetical protein LV84_00216 [Algoriphagus ratkowskyi]TXD79345.1 hypothetical protein ESW18_03700 [Algoriphagus ratkowskyi]
MKQLTFSCFLLFLHFYTIAQTDPLTQVHGARSQAMGNLRVHGMDTWSYFNNPGGLAHLEASAISVGYDNRFGLNELSTVDLVGAWKIKDGTLGLGISRFGGKLFNQQSLGLAFANQLGIVCVGGKLEWFQTQIEGFGNGNSIIFSLGGMAELSSQFSIGASISNLNRSKISKDSETRLPTGVSLGVFYSPIPQLELHLEIEKDIQIKPVVKVGLEYGIKNWIFLRTGINSNPSRMFFGIGLNSSRFTLDYAYGQNQAIGSTNHLSLNFSLAEK